MKVDPDVSIRGSILGNSGLWSAEGWQSVSFDDLRRVVVGYMSRGKGVP